MADRAGATRNRIQARVVVAVAIAVAAAAALVLVAYRDVAPDRGGDSAAVPLSLSLALARDQVSIGEAIPLTVTLRNTGKTALTAARPAIVPTLVYIEVRARGGDEVPFYGPWLRLSPLGRDSFAELAPGGSAEHEFDLAEFYQLPAGDYTVVANYRNPQDGSHLGLHAFVVAGDGVSSGGVTLKVR